MVGIVFAYIGAVIRWILGGCKKSVKYYFLDEGNDDLDATIGNSTLNRIIGLLAIILFMYIFGFFL